MSARSLIRLAQRSLTERRGYAPLARFASTWKQSLPEEPCTQYTEVTHSEDPEQIQPHTQNILRLANNSQLPVYARPPFVLSHGKGAYVWDMQGQKWLDFTAGIAVNALGHGDEEFIKILSTEAAKILHSSNAFYNEHAPRLADLLVGLTRRDGGLGWPAGTAAPEAGHGGKVFFSNSGTEANEGALKIARKVGKVRWAAKHGKTWDDPACDKYEIVCFEQAFHGRSMGALSVTTNEKYQKPFMPLIPGVKVGKLDDTAGLDGLVGEKTCAVIVEPIQGEGGIHAADENWLRALRKKCDEHGAVLIYDEIQCGLYRTGTLWAHSTLPVDCHPDVVTMAKPLANGYPIGAVLMRDSIAEPMTVGSHGTTFGGSPVACALGCHVLERLSRSEFVENIHDTGAYLKARLELLPKWFPETLQTDVRGRGLILGLGFKNPDDPGKMVKLARERGVLILTAGKDAVRLVPSLNIGQGEVDKAVDVLESCLQVLHAA